MRITLVPTTKATLCAGGGFWRIQCFPTSFQVRRFSEPVLCNVRGHRLLWQSMRHVNVQRRPIGLINVNDMRQFLTHKMAVITVFDRLLR